VPSATRSSSASSRGWASAAKAARARSSARVASSVEDHADAGQRLAAEGTARLVGVDDDVGLRQAHLVAVLGRQVVVGDQHLHPECACVGHAIEAGDAVVHRDQQVRRLVQRQVDDGRRQPVAVHGPVRHHVVQRVGPRPEHAQPAQQQRAGGGTVAVVVGHHAQAPALLHHVGQQARRGLGALQLLRRQQLRQPVVQLVGLTHAARGQQARQQRMRTGLLQRKHAARRRVAQFQPRRCHSGCSTCSTASGRQRRTSRRHAFCGTLSKRCAARSPPSVRLTGSPRAARACSSPRRCSSSACQASTQAAQS
jgi:hypothetical protein